MWEGLKLQDLDKRKYLKITTGLHSEEKWRLEFTPSILTPLLHTQTYVFSNLKRQGKQTFFAILSR